MRPSRSGPPDSPLFLNIVVIAETTLEPRTLVERAFAIEDAYGRTRDGERWGPAYPGRGFDHGRERRRRSGRPEAAASDARMNARSSSCRGTRSTRPQRLSARERLAICWSRRTHRASSGEMIL